MAQHDQARLLASGLPSCADQRNKLKICLRSNPNNALPLPNKHNPLGSCRYKLTEGDANDDIARLRKANKYSLVASYASNAQVGPRCHLARVLMDGEDSFSLGPCVADNQRLLSHQLLPLAVSPSCRLQPVCDFWC